ncbi:MAG: ATP-grasp domain-containing protein [Xanthobacteraceae bacterium]
MSDEAVLIAAISGRALAQSAQRGGYRPLVVDFFGDQDTLQVARDHVRLTGGFTTGIAENALSPALEALVDRHQPIGIVCGSGFEDRPRLLDGIAARWQLFGNSGKVVSKVKQPESLSAICGALAIPFPKFSPTKPSDSTGWLAKRIGGAGGSHVRPAAQPASGSVYYQREVHGAPISLLFLADGVRATVVGFSAQWVSPTASGPYRYGGAVQPATLAPEIAAALTSAVDRLVAATSLIGLNSADFHVDGEHFWLLDVNPRPGATLDIFEPLEGSLFALHMGACAGNLAAAPSHPAGAKAAAIVYAEDDIPSIPAVDWPDWTADRPQPGIAIKAGEPLCTVYAGDELAARAKAIADERRRVILSWMGAGRQ